MKILAGLFFISFAAAASTPLPDALGRDIPKITFGVVSLSPAITELIYALGFEKKLSGVSDFSDYPKEAGTKPHVGPYTHPSLEAIAYMRPDLVILPLEGPEDVRQQLDKLHISYAVVKMRKILDIGKTAEQLGSWLGDAKKGKDFADDFNRKVAHVLDHRKESHLKTLIEIQNEPLIAAGRETFLDEIVGRCGGENVITDNDYPHVSMETLVKKHLDLIFLADHFSSAKDKDAVKLRWKKFPSTESAKIYALDPDTTSRPGPRILEGMEKICNIIAEEQL